MNPAVDLSGSWPLPYDISQQKCLLTSSSQKTHQTKSIVTRLQQTKSVAFILNVCGVTTNKTNCFKLLKLKHPACQRPHATWQDLFGHQNGYNRTSYVFIFLMANLDICMPSRQGETLIRTFISPEVVGFLGTAVGRRHDLVSVTPSLNQKRNGMMKSPVVLTTCPDFQPDIRHHFNWFTTLQYFHLWLQFLRLPIQHTNNT